MNPCKKCGSDLLDNAYFCPNCDLQTNLTSPTARTLSEQNANRFWLMMILGFVFPPLGLLFLVVYLDHIVRRILFAQTIEPLRQVQGVHGYLRNIPVSAACVLVGGSQFALLLAFCIWLHADLFEEVFLIGLAVLFAQAASLGAVLAWWPWNWQRRIPVLGCLSVLVIAAEMTLFVCLLSRPRDDIPLLWLQFLALGLMSSMVPISLLPPMSRSRLARWNDESPPPETSNSFSLRQLFTWTTIAGVLLGVFRLLFAYSVTDSQRPFGDLELILAVVAGGQMLISWPIVWATWSEAWIYKAFLCIAVFVVVTTIGTALFAVSLARSPLAVLEFGFMLSVMNFTMGASMLPCLLTVRFYGYRWKRDAK